MVMVIKYSEFKEISLVQQTFIREYSKYDIPCHSVINNILSNLKQIWFDSTNASKQKNPDKKNRNDRKSTRKPSI